MPTVQEAAALRPLWGAEDVAAPDVELLAVHRDGALVGTVALVESATRLAAHAAHARPGAEPQVLAALREHAARRPPLRLEVVVDDAGRDPDALLRAAGFALRLDQVHLRGPLRAPPAPSGAFALRALPAAGARRTLLWLLGRIWAADGTPLGLPPAADLAAIDEASTGPDGRPDRRLWRVALHAGRPAGVVLGHRDPDAPHVGSLAAFGLVPELRGRGLGRALHGDALGLLHGAGLTEYRESTARANAPMRALLAAAGCVACGGTRVYGAQRW